MRHHSTRVRFVLWILILIWFGSAGQARAQSNEPRSLDLQAAVDRALENDPTVKTAQIGLKIAQAKIGEAKTGWQPTIQFTQGITRSNNPVFVFGSLLEQGRFSASNFALESLNHPDGLTNFRTSVGVRAPLFDQFQTRGRVNRADLQRKRADLSIDLASQRLRFEVIRTFYGAILADELLRATDAAVVSAKANTRKTSDFVEVGLVAISDALVANVEQANVEQQRLESQSSVYTTRAALNITIGGKPDAVHDLIGNLQEKYFPVEEQAELLRIALENRSDFQQALLDEKDSREQARSVKDQKLPRIDAFGEYGYSSPYITNGSSDYTVGLSFSYTLYDPGRKSRLEQATLAGDLSTSEKDRLQNQITLEVITAYQNFNTSRAKIQVSIKSVAQAEEALRMIQDRYGSALLTFDAVLRAEAAVLRAKHQLLKARYEYYVSFASILLATGRLTDIRLFE